MENNQQTESAKKGKAPRTPHKQNTLRSDRLVLLVTVVARNKGEYYSDIIQSFGINMQMIALAEGTADAKMLSVLGLTDSAKCVIFSVMNETKVKDVLAELSDKFNTVRNGKGIAYTVPLTSVIGTLIYGFLSDNRMTVKEEK